MRESAGKQQEEEEKLKKMNDLMSDADIRVLEEKS